MTLVGAGAALVAAGGDPQSAGTPGAPTPTFSKDVAPIVFAKCAGCHRPGEVAPMSLLSFEDVRPWAGAIREKVVDACDAAVARRSALRGVPQQPEPEPGRDRHHRQLGERGRAGRQSEGHAGAAEVRRGLADRQARSGVRDGERLRDSRRAAPSTTSTSRSRPTSPRTAGCRRARCAPAIARTCTTSSSTCASRSRGRAAERRDHPSDPRGGRSGPRCRRRATHHGRRRHRRRPPRPRAPPTTCW